MINNTKKGISLIVLVITIIIVIILAAAVILTLNKNNPVDSARIAQLVDSRDSLNSSLLVYVSNAMTKSQGELGSNEIITAKSSNQDLIDKVLGSNPKALIDPNGRKDPTSYLYKISSDCTTLLGINIPTFVDADWYINIETSQFYLIYSAKYPSWMSNDGDTLIDTTLKTFVEKK